MSACYLVLLALFAERCWSRRGLVKRHAQDQLDENSSAISGCWYHKKCDSCLVSKPMVYGGSYCKWCSGTNWVGDPKAVNGKLGVCKAADNNVDDCAGDGWAYVGKQHGFGGKAMRGQGKEDAALFCPRATEDDDAAGQKLSGLTAEDLDSTSKIANILNEINMDLQRINRFLAVNPQLFNKKFNKAVGVAKTVGLYSWKLVTWGITFIPLVGGPLSFGLQKATTIAEASYISKKGYSQDMLISKGDHATLHYFGDVTFGTLEGKYVELLNMSDEELEAVMQTILGGALSGQAGVNVQKAKEVNEHGATTAAKASLATGFFVGGFFTMGATWIAGAVWGGVELAASVSIAETAKLALETKAKLLVAMARQMDASIWFGEGLKCSITSWHAGIDPCPPVQPEAECETLMDTDPYAKDGSKRSCKEVARVCTRESPWGHHQATTSSALSPEGRCMRAPETQLQDGLPCLVHESCHSGYCHFETRLEYFFSNHQREHCTRADILERKCISAGNQVHSLQVMSPGLPDVMANKSKSNDPQAAANRWKKVRGGFSGIRPIEEFAGSYDTYDAVKYATTGTCARACPLSDVGKGDCAMLTLGDTARNLQGVSTEAAEYSFGITLPNRIFTGFGQQGFEIVGDGDCATEDGVRLEVKEVTLTEEKLELKEDAQGCAYMMHLLGKRSFVFDTKTKTCAYAVNEASAPASVLPRGKGEPKVVCYTRLMLWPLDIHQPWNPHWTQYVRNINRITEWLESKREGALEQVQKAYHDFCPMRYKTAGNCPEPEDWDMKDAINFLRVHAPLSVDQLYALCEAIEPTLEAQKKAGDHIQLNDVFKRPLRFGDAWKRYLGKLNVEEVEKEDHDSRAVLQRWYVEKLEQLAVEYNFRTLDDGLWDLSKAMDKYVEQTRTSMEMDAGGTSE